MAWDMNAGKSTSLIANGTYRFSEKAFPIDRAIEHERGRDAIMTKRGDERRRLPMAVRRLGVKADKRRNVIERCFGRLKDFRRIATRYDKLAGNFFSALCLVAIVAYWL